MGKGKRLRLVENDQEPRVIALITVKITNVPGQADKEHVEITGLPGDYESAFSILSKIMRVGLRPYQAEAEKRESMTVTKAKPEVEK